MNPQSLAMETECAMTKESVRVPQDILAIIVPTVPLTTTDLLVTHVFITFIY